MSPALSRSSAPPAPDASPMRRRAGRSVTQDVGQVHCPQEGERGHGGDRPGRPLEVELEARRASSRHRNGGGRRPSEPPRGPRPRPAEAPVSRSRSFRVSCRIYEAVIVHRAEYSSAAVRVRRDRGQKGVAQSCACCLFCMERLECERLRRAWGCTFLFLSNTVVSAAQLRSTFESGSLRE